MSAPDTSMKLHELNDPIAEDGVPGQSKLLVQLRALRYTSHLGGDRAQVALARRLLREGLARCIHVPLELALDPEVDPQVRLDAVRVLAQYGLGAVQDRYGHAGDISGAAAGVALLPSLPAIEEQVRAALAAQAAEDDRAQHAEIQQSA